MPEATSEPRLLRAKLRGLLAAGLCLALSACNIEDDNGSWVLVSNPSAGSPPIQGGIVFGYSSSGGWTLIGAGSSGLGPMSTGVIGIELEELPRSSQQPIRRLFLGTESDFAVSLIDDEAAIHGPGFEAGHLRLTGVTSLAKAPDSARLLVLSTSSGDELHLSAWGNLAVYRSPAYLHVLEDDALPRVFDPRSTLEARGKDLFLREPGGRGHLLTPPAAKAPGHQFAYVRGREAIRFYAPSGQVSAELPASGFSVLDGSGGLLLEGEFPNGASGALNESFRAILPLRNRHLLILRGR